MLAQAIITGSMKFFQEIVELTGNGVRKMSGVLLCIAVEFPLYNNL